MSVSIPGPGCGRAGNRVGRQSFAGARAAGPHRAAKRGSPGMRPAAGGPRSQGLAITDRSRVAAPVAINSKCIDSSTP